MSGRGGGRRQDYGGRGDGGRGRGVEGRGYGGRGEGSGGGYRGRGEGRGGGYGGRGDGGGGGYGGRGGGGGGYGGRGDGRGGGGGGYGGRGDGRGGGGRDGGRGRGGGGYGGDVAPPAPKPSGPPPKMIPSAEILPANAVEELRMHLQANLTLGASSSSSGPEGAPAPASSKLVKFNPRPGFGTLGRKCWVKANHFLVDISDKDLTQYDVTITPEVTSKAINRKVIHQLVQVYRVSHLGGRSPAYDGRKSIYTAGCLPFESKEFEVTLPDREEDPAASRKRDRKFKVHIRYAARPDLEHLQQFLRGRMREVPQETIQVLDIVLRESASMNYTVVGRSFFDRRLGSCGELGNGLEFWRGYYQSLRPTQMGLSFNIDVSARAFYESIPVPDFVFKYFNLRDTHRPMSDQDRIKVRRALKGVRVSTSHSGYIKNHKINGLSNQPLSHLTFTNDADKTNVSVVEYFQSKYQTALKLTHLPALQVGTDFKPTYLPMELCTIVDGQRFSKKLNERQVTALLRATCQRPREREASIYQTVKNNNYSKDALVKEEFGMTVREELTVIDARVLPPPALKYHESGRESNVDPQNGAWNMINKKMVNGARVDNWACISFSRMQPDMVGEFCRELTAMCNSKGMAFNPKPTVQTISAQPNQIEGALKHMHQQSKNLSKQLQLLIVILPDVSGSYGLIKRVCETELGIVSQCCQPKQAEKMNKQYLENVTLKINVKVGGRNTVLQDALLRRIPKVTDHETIIFGADVTHPQPGEDSSPSIAAVVASMDWPEVTKYRVIVSAQKHRQEIIEDLYKSSTNEKGELVHSGMIRDLLIAFRRATNRVPKRIIFYRDGVSEGQFSQVLLHEMDAIRKACQSLQSNYLPPVTFAVVQKRHHTRLFAYDHDKRNEMDRSGNILPGTVVDTHICHPTEFDFYLNSHAGIQGTSRPTHYHVLYDENKFTADEFQSLTNNLCYTYARCTRSVSIVPPAYYAHLAAFRARYYMEGDSSDGGSNSGVTSTGTRAVMEVRQLPDVKENVKDVMFFC